MLISCACRDRSPWSVLQYTWKTSDTDATVQDRHVTEWRSLVKYPEWQIAPRTPLPAQFRAEWGIICIQIVCLYESMMDEHTNIDSIIVSIFFSLLEGQSLTGRRVTETCRGNGRLIRMFLLGRNYLNGWVTVLWVEPKGDQSCHASLILLAWSLTINTVYSRDVF